MFSRPIRCFALVLSLAAPAAQAETIGETINLSLGASGAAALAELPAPWLGTVHSVSTVLAWHDQGLLTDEEAAGFLAGALRDLADAQSSLAAVDEQAYRVAVVLQARVVVTGGRALLASMEPSPEAAALNHAAVLFLARAGETLRQRTHGGANGPDHSCFQAYADCMEYCSRLQGAVERSLCGMDCNLDFAACLGRALGDGAGAFLDGLIRVAGASGMR